jgi:hypothetical protein
MMIIAMADTMTAIMTAVMTMTAAGRIGMTIAATGVVTTATAMMTDRRSLTGN